LDELSPIGLNFIVLDTPVFVPGIMSLALVASRGSGFLMSLGMAFVGFDQIENQSKPDYIINSATEPPCKCNPVCPSFRPDETKPQLSLINCPHWGHFPKGASSN
jgi:hypothetical protein